MVWRNMLLAALQAAPPVVYFRFMTSNSFMKLVDMLDPEAPIWVGEEEAPKVFAQACAMLGELRP
jgi:hypothetical protein